MLVTLKERSSQTLRVLADVFGLPKEGGPVWRDLGYSGEGAGFRAGWRRWGLGVRFPCRGSGREDGEDLEFGHGGVEERFCTLDRSLWAQRSAGPSPHGH